MMSLLAVPAAPDHRPEAVSEDRLWRRYVERREPRVREALAQSYMPFARRMALRYSHASEPLDDLVQVANLGLLNAIDRFDPSRGSSFVAFAAPTILGELKRHFRDRAWTMRVPRGVHDLMGKVEKATARLTRELQRPPSAREIAELLEVDVTAVLEALETSQKRSPLSLDRPLEDGDGDAAGDRIGGEDPGFARVDDRQALHAALPALDRRAREVLRLRFVEELPQSQIAERIGYSQMHVSRILRDALQRLREAAETT
jgi:RNA polymerase sigma-B factor